VAVCDGGAKIIIRGDVQNSTSVKVIF
jgi:hypothetical protein